MAHVLPDSIRCRLGYLLAKTHQRQLKLFEAHTHDLSVSGRQYATLLALEANAELRQSDLAEWLDLDRTTVTYLIDSLEERAWIERQRDPADRRAHIVRLTDAGTVALADIRPAAQAATQELLTPLDDDEQAQLRALLARLLP
ncbi:5'-methylthioadenosine phosphorylase protein [Salinisphaera shabanensis E1L3A]|uniref:5'-methylthioadenosine phosphorylase protein n=1 Tax=Salinisphaera shabanensis E1L3A TaxID=1033802 RepID=U2FPK3_9GAMM|nr:MarR family transcriptional regulator [Salinisphaera shabanensis]ERJ18079.1 5'-methylthioadenosine phosphorylase protein [Salinisphaera shabanensis E1L3A]